jgi:hypothetical protein
MTVPYGFRMAVEHFSKPAPSDPYERIVRETNERLDKLLKHTFVRLSRISAADAAHARELLRP